MIRLSACVLVAALMTAPRSSDDVDASVAAWIDSAGGRYTRSQAGEIIHVDLRNTWITDADLHRLAQLPRLEKINLAYTKITDLGLERLIPLKNVKVLNLYYAEYVTDLGIAHLKHWRNLEYLNVRGTKVTSSLFDHLAEMNHLAFLDVAHSRVTDDLVENLAGLDQLAHLSLGGNKMSGAALPLLKTLPGLRSLSVGGQQRTDSGLWGIAVTDFNIQHVARLEELEVLELGRDERNRSRSRRAGPIEKPAHIGSPSDPCHEQRDGRSGRTARAKPFEAVARRGNR